MAIVFNEYLHRLFIHSTWTEFSNRTCLRAKTKSESSEERMMCTYNFLPFFFLLLEYINNNQ